MLFELEPDNRGASDELLLADLRSVAVKLARNAVSRDEYEAYGRFHPQTLAKRFGSWNATLIKAGLQVLKPHVVSESEFVEDMKRVATLLGANTLTTDQYLEHGRFSLSPLAKLFGRWQDALERAGLKSSPAYAAPRSDAELLENLETVWRTIGRQPKQSDMRRPLSQVGHDVYSRRFGSWRAALEHFVETVNAGGPETTGPPPAAPEAESMSQAVERGAAARIAGWRLRFLVMRRDRFRCCQCGASPALSGGTVLVIDHVTPWSQGGLTTLDNLQTLCVQCNGGKGDLQAGAA